MFQTIRKWQVDVVLSNRQQQSVWISDNFIENVMRQVAVMSFSADPLVQIETIRIGCGHDAAQSNDTGVMTVNERGPERVK